MRIFKPGFSFFLNSEDRYDSELPLLKNQTFGGTMVLWKFELDQYISVYPVSTTSYLPIVFQPPGSPTTVHIALYLPTSGKETEFHEQLILLKLTIEEILDKYPDSLVFLRGDCNVNTNNKTRYSLFCSFLTSLNLKRIPINHKTYHHFIGGGVFDSEIDVLIESQDEGGNEKIEKVFCIDDYPQIDSHHDIILSSISLPILPVPPPPILTTAPRIANTRHRVLWSDEGIASYQAMVSEQLHKMRTNWNIPGSVISISILLQLTSSILTEAALLTNRCSLSNKGSKPNSVKVPSEIRKAGTSLNAVNRTYKHATPSEKASIKDKLKKAKKEYRQLQRRHKHQEDLVRDSKLFSIFSNNPSNLYKSIRNMKSSTAGAVPFLTVGSKRYEGSQVADGMFDSISTLKSQDETKLHAATNFLSWSEDYNYILQLCSNKRDLPNISIEDSTKILLRMKPGVRDFWSITPQHFLHAGDNGKNHFNFLMNKIIMETNAASVIELNTTYALLLHKGHGKSKTSDRSYRTISTCPVLAKGLDMYIHELFIGTWNDDQADTQYQGEGSTHELAALMITEAVQNSLYSLHRPVFLLFLDARSAFDTVVVSFLVRNLYLAGMEGNSVHYINNRLSNRLTYCDWDKEIMGPIIDQQGLEQGGCNSSDLYKMYNNDLLKIVQNCNQGIDMGNGLVISGVGQADDIALLSNDIYNLFNILFLTLSFCKKFNVELCPDKTKLLMISRESDKQFIPFNPISINGKDIPFSKQAEHVGVIRSCEGNMPNLVHRFSAHRKALRANLPCGTPRSHRGNDAACVKIVKLYALFVSFCLVLLAKSLITLTNTT